MSHIPQEQILVILHYPRKLLTLPLYRITWENVENKGALIFAFGRRQECQSSLSCQQRYFHNSLQFILLCLPSLSYLFSSVWIKTYLLEYSFFLHNFVKFLLGCYFTEIEREQKNNFIDSFCFSDTCVQRSIYIKML